MRTRYNLIGGMGNTELVGGEVEDQDNDALVAELVGEIGATHQPRGGNRAALKVESDKLRLARRMVIGFGPGVMAVGGSSNITSQPQVVFRSERLFVTSDIAFDLVVDDVKVGQRSQLIAAGAIPAAIFSEVSIDVFTHWDTAEVGNVLTVSLTNVGADEVTGRAAMCGACALR